MSLPVVQLYFQAHDIEKSFCHFHMIVNSSKYYSKLKSINDVLCCIKSQ